MNTGNCKMCGKKIPDYFYCNALYCSDYCRRLSYDIRKGRSKPEQALKKLQGVVNEGGN